MLIVKKSRFLALALVLTMLVCLCAYGVYSMNKPVSVSAVVISRLDDGRIIIPYQAVRQDADEREFVYVFSQGRAQLEYIEPQTECDHGFVLGSGFDDGEVLILTPDVISESGEMVSLAYS